MTNAFDGTTPYRLSQTDEPAPLVDEAMAATADRSPEHAELTALRLGIDQLKQSLKGTATGLQNAAVAEVRVKVDAQPLKSAFIVASLAFLYGLTR